MPRTDFFDRRLVAGVVLLTSLMATRELFAENEKAPLVVHEWGTFTALDNESGEQLLGINVDTEPVPHFVHNLSPYILNRELLSSDHWVFRQKAVPRHHPSVSLRLETPVIYFYPPKGKTLPFEVDVEVKFRGGWVTEFYPRADVLFPKTDNGQFNFDDLFPNKIGHVAWRKLQVGTSDAGPSTNEHVWTAPRNVAAANLTSCEGEHEKYLFYRGVAMQRSPLKIATEGDGESIVLSATFQELLPPGTQAVIPNLWLMETRDDGMTAYRRLESLPIVNDDRPRRCITAARRFRPAEFSIENRSKLETEMREAIVAEGLFADEARALLSTWQQAYFVSPGLRVFYTVPRIWTDHFLPLSVSGETEITRVMVGRVELISDRQRELLNALSVSKISTGDWLAKIDADSSELSKLLSGSSDIGDLNAVIPADFQMYRELGRFRNALVAAEADATGSTNLAAFIENNQLQPFRLTSSHGP